MSGGELKPAKVRDLGAGVFAEEEIAAYESAGYGRTGQPGRRPALMVVDVTYAFAGTRDGEGHYPLSCGATAWAAVDQIARLLSAARGRDIPIVYSRNSPRPSAAEAGGWSAKLGQSEEPPRAHDIVDEIAPRAGDLVVTKAKPSAFFSTPLVSWLIQLGIDTIFVVGGSTSGCVRATAVDAFSYNFKTFVIAEAAFDRSPTSHQVNLFELHQKYGTVVGVEQVLEAWKGPDGQVV